MLRILSEKDPDRALKLHPNDKKRIVRALEVLEEGVVMTEHDEKTREAGKRFNAAVIVLGFEDRAELYDRIDRRVDDMIAKGLIEEVRGLIALGLGREHTSMQAIGYKEILSAIEGGCTFEDAVDTIKRESRRYAKRQISWCGRYKDACRINFGKNLDFDEGLHASTGFLEKLGIIKP